MDVFLCRRPDERQNHQRWGLVWRRAAKICHRHCLHPESWHVGIAWQNDPFWTHSWMRALVSGTCRWSVTVGWPDLWHYRRSIPDYCLIFSVCSDSWMLRPENQVTLSSSCFQFHVWWALLLPGREAASKGCPDDPQPDQRGELHHRGGARLVSPRLPLGLHLLPLRCARRLWGRHHAFQRSGRSVSFLMIIRAENTHVGGAKKKVLSVLALHMTARLLENRILFQSKLCYSCTCFHTKDCSVSWSHYQEANDYTLLLFTF